MFRKNVASQFIHFQGVDSTTGGIKSGVTYTVRRCLDGTFAAGGGTVTEDGTTGWYKYAMSQGDTNGNNVGFNFTGTGAVPQTINFVTTACDPTTATNFGITALPAVASGSAGALLVDGTGTAAISNSSGKVLLQAAQKVDVDTIKTNPVVNGGTVTFPTNATLASTTNITAGTITTVTTVTNQLTAAAIATGVWQDATAGDFTAAGSIGKSVMNGVALGTGLTVNDLTTKTGFALTAAYDAAKTASQAGDAMTLTAAYDFAKGTTAMVEAYAADGAAFSPAQALYMIWATLAERNAAGTTLTIKKLDGTTTAMTFTLDAASPTSQTRAT